MDSDWLLRSLLDLFLRRLPQDLQGPARALLDRWLEASAQKDALRQALHRAHDCFVLHAPRELARYAQDNPLTDAESLLQALHRAAPAEDWEAALQDLIARAWKGLPREDRDRAARLYTLCLRQALLALPTHGLQALGRELADQRSLLERLEQAWQAWQQEQREALAREIRIAAQEVRIQTPRTEVHAETVVVRPAKPAWEPPHTPEPPPDPEAPLPQPGPLPPGSHMPVPVNPDFTGREPSLRDLARALLGRKGFRAVAMSGPAGVGKTQLAAAFVHRFGRFFCGVLWVPPGQPVTEALYFWAEDLHAAGWFPEVKVLPEKADDRSTMVRALWQRHGPWLVVLDDVPDPQGLDAALRAWGGLDLAVLLTSRVAAWPAYVRPRGLAVFSPQEARTFLRRRLPSPRAWPDAHLERLAERLGRLPMALELAAAYLHRYRLSIPAYLEELDRVGAALGHPSLQGEAATGLTTGHDPNLHAALRLSLERVQEESPEAAELFGYLGHLAPGHPIPLDLLTPTRGPAWEERALRAALARLAGHNLVAWPEEAPGPEVHPLLAELARLEADPGSEALQAWAARVAEAFEERYKKEIERRAAYTAWGPYRPHLKALARAAGERAPAARLWNLLGLYARHLAEYEEARRLLEQALAIWRQVYGEEHPHVTLSLNNLAGVLWQMGEYEEARRLYEQALTIRRQVYGEEHPDVAASLAGLAGVLWQMGEYEEARRLFEQALTIVRQVYGEEHPHVAQSLNNLAEVLRALGEYEEARRLHKQALAIIRQLYGEEHPDVAQSLNNLAGVLWQMGEYEEARRLHEQALAILRQVYGEEHPHVATSLNNLAGVLRALGEYEEARRLFEQALAILRQVYGEEHPDVAQSLNNLAGVLWQMGEYEEARRLHEQALAIFRQVYGKEHPDVATSLAGLAGVLRALGEYEEARRLYEQALAILRKTLPAGHPYIRQVELNLWVLRVQEAMRSPLGCLSLLLGLLLGLPLLLLGLPVALARWLLRCRKRT